MKFTKRKLPSGNVDVVNYGLTVGSYTIVDGTNGATTLTATLNLPGLGALLGNLSTDGTDIFLNITAVPIGGDADADGDVDLSDLSAMATNWQTGSCMRWDDGNFDGDYDVDLSDLSILATNWQAGVASVPEPATISFLAIGAIALLRRRS